MSRRSSDRLVDVFGRHGEVSRKPHMEEPMCRLCWGGSSDGILLSPCACAGSAAFIHVHCLADWLATLQKSGQQRKAETCEICKALWSDSSLHQAHAANPLSVPGSQLPPVSPQPLWLRLLCRPLHTSREIWRGFRLRRPTSWPRMLTKSYRVYCVTVALTRACFTGCKGFLAGAAFGRAICREQSAAVVSLLSSVADLLGTPAAEVLWLQVVAAVSFAFASEFIYATLLGALGGCLIGFCQGYVGALNDSLTLVVQSTVHLASATCHLAFGSSAMLWNALRRSFSGAHARLV
mmetsp:Transcript_18064/g.30919  ORF Transcript_18064/g.30919 Transcript_18064/m.30919 type:complete len:293 (+) Transcript_18064:217-1095(+)